MSKKKYPKPKMPKGKSNNQGQAASYERDGIAQGRITWGRKIVAALQPFGTGDQGAWFTHAALLRRVKDHHQDTPQDLTHELYGLVKTGHIERAIRPDQVQDKQVSRTEYIYRRTAKAYRPKEVKGMNAPIAAMDRARQIQLDNPRLPKWFRDMMTC